MKNEILNKSHSKPRSFLLERAPQCFNAGSVNGSLEFLLIHNNEMLNQVQHDDRGHSGFTLVELLVVVLIIGILAAVALPQYNKAVDKSRYASMMQAARSIENAQETYFMENGEYATEWDQLPVSLPEGAPTDSAGRIVIGSGRFTISATNTSAFYYIEEDRVAAFTQYHSSVPGNTLAGKTYCFTYKTDYRERAKAICTGFGGQYETTNNSCTSGKPCEYYVLRK